MFLFFSFVAPIRLNHCVGGRNYVAFLIMLVSSVVAGMVILAAVVAELVFYYTNSEWLVLWSSSTATMAANKSIDIDATNAFLENMPSQAFNESFATNLTTIATSFANVTEALLDEGLMADDQTAKGINLHDTLFLVFIAILGILAAVSVGLLLHLFFFHVYISFLGLTTYEYIRSQRQQNNIPTTNSGTLTTIAPLPSSSASTLSTSQPATTLNALNKSSSASQLFFCSSIDPKNLVENHNASTKYRPKSLHCCDQSMEYQKTTHKAFYMCSFLHERNATIGGGDGAAAIAANTTVQQHTPINKKACQSRTFHCCSEYKQVVRMPTPTVAHIDINEHARYRGNINDTANTNQYVQYSEQCTFCSFKIKPSNKPDDSLDEHQQQHQHQQQSGQQQQQQQRCCDKTMTNHHRWKRKWNCCSSVPDSPDTPSGGDVLHTVSAAITADAHDHPPHHPNGAKNLNYSLRNSIKPMQTAKGTNNFRPSLSTNLKNGRSRLVRPWPIARFRHILRMIGRCRQPTNHGCHEATNGHTTGGGTVSVKPNQVRPLSVPDQPKNASKNPTLLPTSVIRGGAAATAASATGGIGGTTMPDYAVVQSGLPARLYDLDSNNGNGGPMKGNVANAICKGELSHGVNVSVPALPPPTRRKIRNTSDLDELAESLTFVQQQPLRHNGSSNGRRRRKNLLRARSPTLSPIHETGYSNPASPQLCRHGATAPTTYNTKIKTIINNTSNNSSTA